MQYPVIIKLYGIDELILLQDESAWQAKPHYQTMQLSAADCLIDSNGTQFSLQAYRRGQLSPTGAALNLDAIMALIQRHAADGGACCIAKIHAPSIKAALQLLA